MCYTTKYEEEIFRILGNQRHFAPKIRMKGIRLCWCEKTFCFCISPSNFSVYKVLIEPGINKYEMEGLAGKKGVYTLNQVNAQEI